MTVRLSVLTVQMSPHSHLLESPNGGRPPALTIVLRRKRNMKPCFACQSKKTKVGHSKITLSSVSYLLVSANLSVLSHLSAKSARERIGFDVFRTFPGKTQLARLSYLPYQLPGSVYTLVYPWLFDFWRNTYTRNYRSIYERPGPMMQGDIWEGSPVAWV